MAEFIDATVVEGSTLRKCSRCGHYIRVREGMNECLNCGPRKPIKTVSNFADWPWRR